jgi:PKD repeat protein
MRSYPPVIIFCLAIMTVLISPVIADMTNIYPNIGGYDGSTYSFVSGDFATARATAGSGSDSAGTTIVMSYLKGGASADTFAVMYRGEMILNMAGKIPANATVSAVVLRAETAQGYELQDLGPTSYVVVRTNPASVTTISDSDFNIARYNTTPLSDWKLPINATVPINWTLNSDGVAYVQDAVAHGRTVNLSMMSQWDQSGVFNGTWANNNVTKMYLQANESWWPPYLEVTYTTPPVYPPVAMFTVSSTSIFVFDSITFIDRSSNSPTNWEWNFGDGNTSNLQNVNYGWYSAGTYTVTLNASNSAGYSTNTSCLITVKNLVASINGLSNTTECDGIRWQWTNPPDPNFNKINVYKNGVFYHELSNTTTHDDWNPLATGTDYTFSSQTCDILGYCNLTWENKTTRTLSSCPAGAPSVLSKGPWFNAADYGWIYNLLLLIELIPIFIGISMIFYALKNPGNEKIMNIGLLSFVAGLLILIVLLIILPSILGMIEAM